MTVRPPGGLRLAALALLVVFPIPCFADEPAADTQPAASLIHLDGSGVLSARSLQGFLEGRIFGGAEDLSYFGVGASLGLNRGWEHTSELQSHSFISYAV